MIPDYYPLPEIGQAWEDNPDWTYPLAADGTCGHAHLRTWAARFARTGDGMLAVVTELAGNPGVSVTNGARWIMNALMRSYPGEDIVLFEHYPAYAGETEHLDGVIWGGDPMTYWRGGKPGWYRIWPAGRDHPRYEQLRDWVCSPNGGLISPTLATAHLSGAISDYDGPVGLAHPGTAGPRGGTQ